MANLGTNLLKDYVTLPVAGAIQSFIGGNESYNSVRSFTVSNPILRNYQWEIDFPVLNSSDAWFGLKSKLSDLVNTFKSNIFPSNYVPRAVRVSFPLRSLRVDTYTKGAWVHIIPVGIKPITSFKVNFYADDAGLSLAYYQQWINKIVTRSGLFTVPATYEVDLSLDLKRSGGNTAIGFKLVGCYPYEVSPVSLGDGSGSIIIPTWEVTFACRDVGITSFNNPRIFDELRGVANNLVTKGINKGINLL